jgi:subtilisin family serine protease
VVRTYDFLRIKNLLDPDPEANTQVTGTPITGIASADLETAARGSCAAACAPGRSIDWDLLEPLLRISTVKKHYPPPRVDSHGTHVAGILAANWREAPDETPLTEPLLGVCPELELYDLRVLPDDPKDTADEFTIIAALQFIRHMNAHKDMMVVHGVNLSLSVPHDVANHVRPHAGVRGMRRAAASGVIVVTVAGNRGFNAGERRRRRHRRLPLHQHHRSATPTVRSTVGSDHRTMPHTTASRS